MMASLWHAFTSFFSKSNAALEQPNRKRRRDDSSSYHDFKIRCVDGSGFNGESLSLPLRESENLTYSSEVNPGLTQWKSSSVNITNWGQNGKENCVQYLRSLRNTMMDAGQGSPKNDVDDILVVEDLNRRRPYTHPKEKTKLPYAKDVRSSTRNGPDVEVVDIQLPPEAKSSSNDVQVLKEIFQSPKVGKANLQSDVHIVRECVSVPKEKHSFQRRTSGKKPFKVLNPSSFVATSTPMLFSNQRPVENVHVPSASLFNSTNRSQYRLHSSNLSLDSSTNRGQSTLKFMKNVEESANFGQMMKFYCDNGPKSQKHSPLSYGQVPLVTLDDSEESPSCSQVSHRRSLRTPLCSKGTKELNLLHPANVLGCDRVNVQVNKNNLCEPSTSAIRQQSNDADIQCLGQVAMARPIHPSARDDYLDELLAKYAEKNQQQRIKEIEELTLQSNLLEKRNKLAEEEKHKKMLKEITDSVNNFYFRAIEDEEEVEEEEKVPPLPELTAEMQSEIDRALKAGPDVVLVSAFNLTIKGRDIETLRPAAWLNDEVINFYMNLLIERGKSEKYPSVYAFNTFFFPKLISSGYDSLKRWTRKVDVFAHDLLIVPVHRGVHWCMAIIDMKGKKIRYFDSMNGPFPQCLDALLNYLHKESLDKKKQAFDSTGWTKEHAEDIPQQHNGSDCGMFACMYAEYVSRSAAITFTQDDMPYFRRKAVYEILKTKLLC